ncbi:TOMM precursor leader peptide-binding protein [Streptomyces fagopyri]|uniref:TOMM leader peptide-binding protein n=1 Tax=Streptomyces fagopyri TaxID=2662397 RepID=A0A5Q0LL19_9ACTN|nr:TOMM precursor leader peptide-binding protein [Streptomyces fagopyri]QFZ77783.1 TOMM precursor leader peptide-binding protein [Streptomyces fagopyri]
MANAPASYEEIAQSRPRIRRDVLFTRTPSGVLFHNAHGGFNVVTQSAYRFATLIVPHFDGERRVEELCVGLGDKQRDMVVQLVRALYARGFARDAALTIPAETLSPQVENRFAHQLDYLDHYADDAPGRFLRFRSTPVAVLGDDALARWAALGLLRNGCAAVAVTEHDEPSDVLSRELHGVEGVSDLDAEAAALAGAGCAPRLVRLPAPGAATLVEETSPVAPAVSTGADAEDPRTAGARSGDGTYGWQDLDGWDTVLVTGAAGRRQLLRLLAEGVPEGRRLLGAWTFGNRAVVGPVMTTGTVGCWCCAALRLGAGADAADSAELWASVGPATPLGAPAHDLTGPLAGMLGNLLAFEVFRLATGALPAETRNQIVVQDLDSLDVLTEPLLPHPRCPYCAAGNTAAVQDPGAVDITTGDRTTGDKATVGTTASGGTAVGNAVVENPAAGRAVARNTGPAEPAAPPGDVLRAPHPDDEPAAPPGDGAADEDAARTLLTALEERDVLVHERAGVFTAFADDDWEQTPLKLSTVRLGVGPGRVRRVCAADVHTVAGARLTALFRAAEVYAEHVVPPRVFDAPGLRAAVGRWTRVAPPELALSSGLDVPADRVAHWSEAVSLTDGRTVLVPTAAVRTLGGWNNLGLFERSSAGTGAAGSPRAALARALTTALALDASRGAVRRTAPVPTVDHASLTADPELLFLLRSADNLGVTVEILDLTAAGGGLLPVTLARLTDPATGAVRWATGGGLRHRDAVLEALRDLLGAEQVRRAADGPDTGDPMWADLDAGTLVAEGTVPLPDSGTTWAAVLDGLAAAGRDALAVPVPAPDLAAGHIHTARVLLTRGAPCAD